MPGNDSYQLCLWAPRALLGGCHRTRNMESEELMAHLTGAPGSLCREWRGDTVEARTGFKTSTPAGSLLLNSLYSVMVNSQGLWRKWAPSGAWEGWGRRMGTATWEEVRSNKPEMRTRVDVDIHGPKLALQSSTVLLSFRCWKDTRAKHPHPH